MGSRQKSIRKLISSRDHGRWFTLASTVWNSTNNHPELDACPILSPTEVQPSNHGDHMPGKNSSLVVFFLGAAENNFTFVPHFIRFHWSYNADIQNFSSVLSISTFGLIDQTQQTVYM